MNVRKRRNRRKDSSYVALKMHSPSRHLSALHTSCNNIVRIRTSIMFFTRNYYRSFKNETNKVNYYLYNIIYKIVITECLLSSEGSLPKILKEWVFHHGSSNCTLIISTRHHFRRLYRDVKKKQIKNEQKKTKK